MLKGSRRNKINVATITIADRTISDLPFELRPAWRFAAGLLPLPPPFIRFAQDGKYRM